MATPTIIGLPIGAANTSSTGTGTIGTTMWKLLEAAGESIPIRLVRFQPVASSAGTSTTATVIRLYISRINTGATTQADTWTIGEYTAAAQTADSASAATYPIDALLNIVLPKGFCLLASTHHANAANTSWTATVFAGGA